jgi:beta-phosphoglucomutase-like phosphatase (HAD superfamily)
MTLKTRLVIFDCDGVIVDSVPVHSEVIARSLSGYGLNISAAEAEVVLGSGKMSGVAQKARELGADLPENWDKEVLSLIFQELRKGVPLIPEIHSALDALDDLGIGYCVASNGSRAKMQIMLGDTGILERASGAVFRRMKSVYGNRIPGCS